MHETADFELGSASNVSIDSLVKSIITDKSEGVKDAQLMRKVKDYERSLLDVEDSKRLLRTLEERRRRRELNSSILQTTKLEKIGAQIVSAQFKKSSGSPTCICASSKLMAIGTSHGLTLVFDHFQTLKLVVGATDGVEYGRVYSVAFSPDSEWLVVGHHLGQIVVWDLVAAKPVKVLTNDAPLALDSRSHVPVIFVDFVEGKRTKFMALSLDGVLNIHNLTRVFLVTIIDTHYLLSGAAGAGSVLAIAPLQPDPTKSHPVDAFNLLACATFKRIVVFPAADKSSVIYHLKRPDSGREGALPYLAWRELVSTSKSGKTKLLDPVLAVGWGNSIVLVQIIQTLVDERGIALDPTDVNTLVFRRVAAFNTDTEITSIHWLGTGVLVYTNNADDLRVVDPFSIEEIEIDHIKHMELAYHTKFTGTRQTLPGAPGYESHMSASSLPTSSSSSSSSAQLGQLSPSPSSLPSSTSSSSDSPIPSKRKTPAIPQKIIDTQRASLTGHKQSPAVTNREQTQCQSFHASICSYRGKLYMIGMKSPYVTIVLGWSERIAAMVEKGKWLDALALSLDFYHGRAKAVKGLPRDPVRAAAKISARIEQLLHEYVKANLAIAVPKDPAHFDIVATVCIDYCLILGRIDILFQLLYPLFQQRKKAGLLLEKLEPFILGDKLTSLPPDIIQQLVRHYVSQPELIPKLEQLLLHIDIGLLDFHSVVNLCIKHHLSTALFHLYIDGLQDFITPMDHLMKVLVKDLDLSNQFATPEMKELKTAIGLKLILYLSYIFKGKSFPSTDKRLTPRKVDELRETIFDYLLVQKLGGELAGERYPRIRVLLTANSHELLNVLRIALDGMSNPTRLVQITEILVTLMVDPSQGAGKTHSLFWSDKPNPSWPFSPSQIAELYYFIAHYYSSGALDISDDILQRITGYALLSFDEHHDKRERLLLEVLRSCPEEKLEYQKLALLAESAKFYKVCDFFFTHRRDYGAVIRCHILDPDYRKSIFSFVKTLMTSTDPSNPGMAGKSSGATSHASSASTSAPNGHRPTTLTSSTQGIQDPRFVAYALTDKEKEDVRKVCIERITDLIKIDNERTANLVINVLEVDQTQIMTLLNPYPEIQLLYLKACLQVGIDSQNDFISPEEFTESYVGPSVTTPTKRKSAVKRMKPPRLSSGTSMTKRPPIDLVAGEKLLELLCRFEPNVVVHWLKENESVYRLDAAIEITKHFKIMTAYAALQETAGDMKEVLRIMLEDVDHVLVRLYERSRHTKSRPPFGTNGVLDTQEEEELVQDSLDAVIAFCKRNQKRMEASESQELWFNFLDHVMQPLGEIEARLMGKTIARPLSSDVPPSTTQTHTSSATTKEEKKPVAYFENRPNTDLELLKYHLGKLVSRVLDAMVGYVDLQAVLEKILNDRVDSKVSDFRDIFTRLLENYTHERNILGAVVQVLKYDTHQQFEQLVRRKHRGIPGRYVSVEKSSSRQSADQQQHAEKDGSQEQEYTQQAIKGFMDYEPSRLQLLRSIDSGDIRKLTHSGEHHSMRRDALAAMRNVQLQPTVPGAMPRDSMFHSVVRLDENQRH